jgi:hypothetical protein
VGKGVEGSGCGLIGGISAYVSLEGLKKNTEDPSQDSRSPGRVLNQEPPEYEPGLIPIQPRRRTFRFKYFRRYSVCFFL